MMKVSNIVGVQRDIGHMLSGGQYFGHCDPEPGSALNSVFGCTDRD